MSERERSSKGQDAIEGQAQTQRRFSVAAAIGEQGRGLFEGETIVPALVQATNALCVFTDAHLPDPGGVLRAVMRRTLSNSETRIAAHLSEPFVVLAELIDSLLAHDHRLHELVRQVDFEWGRLMQERPHFQQPGQPAHPDDAYTHASVRQALEILRGAIPP